MQVSDDLDLSRLVQSAIRAKAPFVGIPMPGHAALTFNRSKLSAALRGVTPVNIEVISEGASRYLLIEGTAGPNVRTRMKMLSKEPRFWRSYEGKKILDAWHKDEERKRKKVVTIPAHSDRKAAARIKKAAVTLRRLEKELTGMGYPVTLRNPAVPVIREYAEASHDEYARQRWAESRKSKRMRTVIGGIAAQARRENWTNVKLYKELSAHGYDFEKLTDMTPRERDYRGASTFWEYIRNLYRFVRGANNLGPQRYPYRGHQRTANDWQGDGQQWGGGRYLAKLADMQQRRALLEHIENVKALMAGEQLTSATPAHSEAEPETAAA